MRVYEYVRAVRGYVFCDAARKRLERYAARSGADTYVFHGNSDFVADPFTVTRNLIDKDVEEHPAVFCGVFFTS